MAKKVIETISCDACAAKGEETAAVMPLIVGEDEYDLCQEHGDKFRTWFADLFTTNNTALSA